MTQSKPKSLRILPSQKKNGRTPAAYLFIGFLSGAILGGSAVYLWSIQQTAPMAELKQENTTAAQTTNQADNVTSATTLPTPESTADHIAQPQDNELRNIFRHEHSPVPATNAVHASSKGAHHNIPRHNNTKETQTVAFPVVTPSSEKTVPATNTTTENSPQASLHIAVTQSPFTVKENQ
ncbi:hypothetical protein [Acinetobacter sp. MB5]|uniref:hypothetical protein n=1 Tax=Acinetobacter sp. MB5 TaxID=2069438 RepID=UPI000DCFAC25|nr:hypothetical protein [Acinetobacter sp. MB5]